jgi:hypothetical protein
VTDVDERALSRLVLRYAQAVDRSDIDAIVALMTSGATISTHRGDSDSDPVSSMTGHAEIRTAMARLERYVTTFHLVGNQLFEIDGDDATGETYCTAHHVQQRDDVLHDMTMYIRYRDRFVRAEHGWLFAQRRLCVDFSTDRETGL